MTLRVPLLRSRQVSVPGGALDAARKAARDGALTGRDALIARAEVEERERVAGTLVDHAGPYDPAEDPFGQGERDARDGRAPRAHMLPRQR